MVHELPNASTWRPKKYVKALVAENGGKYYLALDPLWNGESEQDAEPF